MNHRRIEGDCLEVMRDLPRGSFDLLLTDPPNAMPASLYNSNWGKKSRRWSDASIVTVWWRVFMSEAIPALKENAMMAVFASPASVAAMWPIMHEVTQNLQIAVWDKGSPGMGCPFSMATELIIVGSRGRTFRRHKGIANILRHKRIHPTKRVHQAQKPQGLLVELAQHLCPDGGRVLDPFAGSFSTEAACDSLGLECTSIEWGEAFAMPDDQGKLAI